MEPKEEVRAKLTSPTSGAVYLVTAFRPISREEALAAIQRFNADNPQAQPKRGEEVVVRTIIGRLDP